MSTGVGRCRISRLAGVFGAVLSAGCGSSYLEDDETDVVVTFEDEDRDYSEIRTYLLPDKVVDLCEASAGGAGGGTGRDIECKEADHSVDDKVLAELRENMNSLGYREIEDAEKEEPDVAFFVGIIAQDNWFLATSPGYCYDYFYYYWGCWYPSYSYAYNLPTSTIVIDMADVEETKDGEFASAWTALLQGMQRGSSLAQAERRVEKAMSRAFSQSPYLAEGGDQ